MPPTPSGNDSPGLDGARTPVSGRLAYGRDRAGALEVTVGTLLTPDVLVYDKAGAGAVHDTLRVGPTPFTPPLTREGIALLPNARVGVTWAVTDRLSVAVEAGVARVVRACADGPVVRGDRVRWEAL